jgi:hypothetical protein
MAKLVALHRADQLGSIQLVALEALSTGGRGSSSSARSRSPETKASAPLWRARAIR